MLAFSAACVYGQDQEGGPSADAQEVAGLRKLRLRRPRPISIDNEEGIAHGKPVALRRPVPAGSA